MGNKYYTPEKEEFHPGFKYEVFQKGEVYDPKVLTTFPIETEDKWLSFKYPDPFLGYNLDRMFKTYIIRVKYLDEEDIESVGFNYSENRFINKPHHKINVILFRKQKDSSFYYEIVKDELSLNVNIVLKQINSGFSKLLFQGDIKNKSEFKKLLKQLNVQN